MWMNGRILRYPLPFMRVVILYLLRHGMCSKRNHGPIEKGTTQHTQNGRLAKKLLNLCTCTGDNIGCYTSPSFKEFHSKSSCVPLFFPVLHPPHTVFSKRLIICIAILRVGIPNSFLPYDDHNRKRY